mmetsp:Transcript_12145/g.34821  ORF Transcript_12145/g.34821 Transcript_12145/m.34821 type:complete len:320 (+) Transcript_12145:79-1038(+)
MAHLIPLLSLGVILGFAHSLALQVTVNQRQSECLFDKLEKDETVTLSAFILSGSSLKATLTFDGPIAESTVDSGMEIYTASEGFNSNGEGHISHSQVMDFEHLAPAPEDDDETTKDDDEGPLDPLDPDIAEKRKARREKQRKKFMEAKAKREQRKLELQKKIRQDGDPIVFTTKAASPGWYRMCVQATWYQVVVEMEMRKESELGGLDEYGHVLSYEERTMNEEDSELDKDTASQEGIKDEDFDETRNRIKDLRRLLNEIQSMQQKERRRLTVHAETNEHSHSRMVLSSLLETLLFMAITGYQIYTIRRWFSGAPVLGR